MEQATQVAETPTDNQPAAPAPTTPTETPTTFLQTKEAAPTDWTTTVPDKFKGENGINHEAIYKSYSELESKMGKFGLAPEAPDKYEFSYEPNAESPLPLNGEIFDNLKTLAHGLGFSQKQFEPLAKGFEVHHNNTVKAVMEKFDLTPEAKIAKTESTLKELWGNDIDNNMGLAIKGFNVYAKDIGLTMDDVGNDSAAIRILAELGSRLGEDKGAVGDVVTQQTLEDLMYSPAYTNQHHKDHARVNARVNELRAQGYKLQR